MDFYTGTVAPILISRAQQILDLNPKDYFQLSEACLLICSVGERLLEEEKAFKQAAQRCLEALSYLQDLNDFEQVSIFILTRKIQNYINLS